MHGNRPLPRVGRLARLVDEHESPDVGGPLIDTGFRLIDSFDDRAVRVTVDADLRNTEDVDATRDEADVGAFLDCYVCRLAGQTDMFGSLKPDDSAQFPVFQSETDHAS